MKKVRSFSKSFRIRSLAYSFSHFCIVGKKRGRGRPVLNDSANKKSTVDSLLSDMDRIDPNEPVYCICRQIAYGEMIACDNEECEIEWFHYSCVNLSKQPKNAWFCSTCKKI